MKKKAVILLSGGLDSATVAAIANQDYDLSALSFFYGQRHKIELEFAKKIADSLQIKNHKIIKINLDIFGCSALTDQKISVPKDNLNNNSSAIPITYVPARNAIFLSCALAFAETIGAADIFIGVNAIDYSGYPDCRREFIQAFETMANLATATANNKNQNTNINYKIHTPLIAIGKSEIIKLGLLLGVDYKLTHSCYDPIIKDHSIYACGHCDSCLLRLKAFQENNLPDPYLYIT